MQNRWDPWKALAARKHIHFEFRPLPESTGGGFYLPVGRRAGIFIDPKLNRVERRCVLAHELVHDERWGGNNAPYMPADWQAVVAREESLVDETVAHRLVPPVELAEFCAAMCDVGLAITAAEVAEHFDVTEDTATRALRRLKGSLWTLYDAEKRGSARSPPNSRLSATNLEYSEHVVRR